MSLSLSGIVACVGPGVTHFFQREWGANQVLAAMRTLCESKGATVCGVGDVRWFSLHRKQQIAQVVEELGRLF